MQKPLSQMVGTLCGIDAQIQSYLERFKATGTIEEAHVCSLQKVAEVTIVLLIQILRSIDKVRPELDNAAVQAGIKDALKERAWADYIENPDTVE